MIVFLLVLTLGSLELPKTIPIQSAYHRIDSKVKEAEEPGFLTFHVTAPHAVYDETGLVPLAKLIREIEVIERVETENQGTGFLDGAADSIEATGEGFVKLVSHPVESGKDIGRAAGKLGGKIGGMFRDKEEAEKTTFGEKVFGSAKREVAKEFGVDVYTANPHLQVLLNKMARARMGGKGAAMVVKFLLPLAALVSATLTVSGVNSAADQLVNDNDKVDLYRMNREALGILGFNQDEIRKFLGLSFYTPRESTYMRFYLEKLKGAKGNREIFYKAKKAKTLWQARKILYEAQIAADAEDSGKFHFDELQVTDEGLAAIQGSKLFFITPYDYLDQSSNGKDVLKAIDKLKDKKAFHEIHLWNGGKIALDFSGMALLQGIRSKGWFLIRQQPEL